MQRLLVGRRLLALVPFAAALAVSACGGSGVTDPSPSPSPIQQPQEVRTVVSKLTGASLEADYVGMARFTTSGTGTLEVTVDWTYASNDVDVALASGECSLEQLEADQCRILAAAVSETAKPERVQLPGAAAGTYTLIVANLGPGDESVSYEVVLASTGVAAAARPTGGPLRWKRAPRGAVELP